MKKSIIFLILLIPLFSFSQSFDDIMSIDSKEQFIRIMVENGYERVSSSSDNQTIYAFDPSYDDEGEPSSTVFASHLKVAETSGAVLILVQLKNLIGEMRDSQYDRIFDIAKTRCEYESLIENIANEGGGEMVQYKCDWNEDFGKAVRRIAFSKKGGTGYVQLIYGTTK